MSGVKNNSNQIILPSSHPTISHPLFCNYQRSCQQSHIFHRRQVHNQRQKDVEENLLHLRRVMKRIRATVEMEEGQCITNQAMVQQLQMLREAMYKGCYLIDTFSYQMLQQQVANDKGGHPFTLSTLTPAKHLCFSMGRTSMVLHGGGVEEVQKMTGNLDRLIEENIVKFGTTGAIRLKFLYQEAYWYFFKVIAFGSINPDEHRELVSIAMEIAAELNGSFVAANIICTLLRANLNTRFWRKILELERRNAERNILLFGERTQTLLQKNQSAYIWALSNNPMSFKVRYETHSPHNELPKALLYGIQLKSPKDCGELELLVWRSCIPPYHSYTIRCDMEAPKGMMSKKKQPHSMA